MLAAGRPGTEIARFFRVYHATISRIHRCERHSLTLWLAETGVMGCPVGVDSTETSHFIRDARLIKNSPLSQSKKREGHGHFHASLTIC